MRKFVKNSILEIFQTMYEAHVSIKKMIDKKDFENVQVLLQDCQNTAVQIGTSIESSEGEGFVTVGYLEEYCEAVYEVATSISDDYSGNKAQKVLDKKLIKAENSVKNDVKVRLEIVFCPYKASMWDSLESVWKAADEDPDCDAYVVPIPYYDRNPDYSFGEFHYEGGDYPDYVPITHYEAYNFEARRPDVIYIHNPYDDCNYVTSVDPRFYSDKLKEYTDMLVYIPYFVLSEMNPSDENQIKGAAHFVCTPAVVNSDRIIVQSEKMKECYLNILFNNDNESKKLFQKRIYGLGSPKTEKAIKTYDSDYAYPEQWKNILYDDDNNKKKVVMYNNSVSSMLQHNETAILAISKALDFFYENRNHIALIWRPHPLIEATISSMRPHLLQLYQAVVNKYIEDSWGIFDDSANLNRAIALSDVYYGDQSSLVPICRDAGLSILIQSVEK